MKKNKKKIDVEKEIKEINEIVEEIKNESKPQSFDTYDLEEYDEYDELEEELKEENKIVKKTIRKKDMVRDITRMCVENRRECRKIEKKTGIVPRNKSVLNKSAISECYDRFISYTYEQLRKGNKVFFTGFGYFEIIKMNGCVRYNFEQGKPIHIPCIKKIKFKCSRSLHDEINERKIKEK